MCVLRSLARSFTRLLALVTAQIHSKKALTSAYVQNKKKITARSSRRYSDQTTKISSGYTDVHAACIAPYSQQIQRQNYLDRVVHNMRWKVTTCWHRHKLRNESLPTVSDRESRNYSLLQSTFDLNVILRAAITPLGHLLSVLRA